MTSVVTAHPEPCVSCSLGHTPCMGHWAWNKKLSKKRKSIRNTNLAIDHRGDAWAFLGSPLPSPLSVSFLWSTSFLPRQLLNPDRWGGKIDFQPASFFYKTWKLYCNFLRGKSTVQCSIPLPVLRSSYTVKSNISQDSVSFICYLTDLALHLTSVPLSCSLLFFQMLPEKEIISSGNKWEELKRIFIPR